MGVGINFCYVCLFSSESTSDIFIWQRCGIMPILLTGETELSMEFLFKNAELQVRRGIEYNSEIIFISQQKHMWWVTIYVLKE